MQSINYKSLEINNGASIFQIEVSLLGISPRIWRRLHISSETNLSDLHHIIQKAMGWKNLHDFQFIANGKYFYQPKFEYKDEANKNLCKRTVSLSKTRVCDLLEELGDMMTYEYDFNLDWQHRIILEEILPPDANPDIPVCIAGERSCPPEDCGGIWGYANLLSEMRCNKSKSIKFNPDHFSKIAVNNCFGKV